MGLTWLICKECDALPKEMIIAGVQGNNVIPKRIKMKYLNAITKTAAGRKLVKKLTKDIQKGKK